MAQITIARFATMRNATLGNLLSRQSLRLKKFIVHFMVRSQPDTMGVQFDILL